jgi:hypothetical protein
MRGAGHRPLSVAFDDQGMVSGVLESSGQAQAGDATASDQYSESVWLVDAELVIMMSSR